MKLLCLVFLVFLVGLLAVAVPAQEISSFSPTSGTVAGGTVVVVSGTGFGNFNVLNVSIAQTACQFLAVNDTTLICVTGPAAQGTTGPVVVTFRNFQSIESNDTYLYVSLKPTVSNVSPNNGPMIGGTTVNITGANLGEYAKEVLYVSLAGINCSSVQYISSTQLICISAASSQAGPGDVIVFTAGGGASDDRIVRFTYNQPPQVISINPAYSVISGGGQLYISYSQSLDYPITITIGSYKCEFVDVDFFDVICTIPEVPITAVGIYPVVISTPNRGPSNSDVLFQYYPLPIITQFYPDSGPLVGGTVLHISGQYFNVSGTNAVAIFDTESNVKVPCQSFQVISDVDLTCVTSAWTDDVRGYIQVTTAYKGQALSRNLFSYNDPPVITNIVPDNGPMSGETLVDISGDSLGTTNTDVEWVTVAGVNCTSIIWYSTKRVTCITAPSSQPKRDAVLIKTISTGEVTPSTRNQTIFMYNQLPNPTSIVPSTAPEAGGATVFIYGTDLGRSRDDVLDVVLGSSSCISTLTYYNSTTLSCVLPPRIPMTGISFSVVISTKSAGMSSPTRSPVFTYNLAPRVDSVYPPAGPSNGFSVVQIYGQNLGTSLSDVKEVLIANVSCRFSLTYISESHLSCVTPTVQGTLEGDIVVQTASGGTGFSYNASFTFQPTCYSASTYEACNNADDCYWCSKTANCLGDRESCPESCGSDELSCGGLIMIILMLVMLLSILVGIYVIAYYVNRDEDLKRSLKKFSRRYHPSNQAQATEPLVNDDAKDRIYSTVPSPVIAPAPSSAYERSSTTGSERTSMNSSDRMPLPLQIDRGRRSSGNFTSFTSFPQSMTPTQTTSTKPFN